jgi:hypothetical protein
MRVIISPLLLVNFAQNPLSLSQRFLEFMLQKKVDKSKIRTKPGIVNTGRTIWHHLTSFKRQNNE